MKNLFDPVLVEDTKQRILRLRPESERQWGSMGVAQTLAHCTAGVEMATGVIQTKRAPFPASLLGRLIKPMVFRNDEPMRRNSPTAQELIAADAGKCDFVSERTRLIDAVEDFVSRGPAVCTNYPHPFFGPLKPEQWAILMYKHVDHHLRQFGV